MTVKMDALESRRVVEWDWTVTPSWNRLHAPLRWDDPHYSASDEHGQTVCGWVGWLSIPGVFARMATPRCAHCCRLTGFPRGNGSPKNDDACRPLVIERLDTLGLGGSS